MDQSAVIQKIGHSLPLEDTSRVLQGIVQGIGFLGAGAIIDDQARQKAQGLTTAANIWATAGIGMLAGLGLEATAVLSAAIMLISLAVIPFIIPSVPELHGEHDAAQPDENRQGRPQS